MEILTAIISILALTGLTRLWNSFSRFKICPICAGVSGTWAWMLAAYYIGYGVIDPLLIAVLIGGSVVGIAYKAAKRVPERLDLAWKTTFIPIGFAAAYELLNWNWAYFAPLLIALCAVYWFFAWRKPQNMKNENSKVEEIKKGLEKCC